ncbi:protein MENT [Suncus etruscus]|uniref:protein MENT n=1 Tax=Suncus etruscus TaxID=109475 RepID=UPI002110A8B6|nr:protein MENT [Suncus etruscus]
MVPAAPTWALFWALLLLDLGAGAVGTEEHAAVSTPRPSSRSPARTYSSQLSRSTSPARRDTTVEEGEEDDLMVVADQRVGPATAELLASTATGLIRTIPDEDEDDTLEEGSVVVNTRKTTEAEEDMSSTAGPSPAFPSNVQEPEIRMTTTDKTQDSPGTSSISTASSSSVDEPYSENTEGTESTLTTLNRWTTYGSTPERWRSPPPIHMPPPEDLRLVLLPWGPWHCHCKAGTMTRSRAGKLQGLSGRLRVGALNQLRTEHKPCTYRQCSCDRQREECPLDDSDYPPASSTSKPRPTSKPTSKPTTKPTPRPRTPPLFRPRKGSALVFWKRVRIGLEDIWNSLSSVFTQMQPIDRNRR